MDSGVEPALPRSRVDSDQALDTVAPDQPDSAARRMVASTWSAIAEVRAQVPAALAWLAAGVIVLQLGALGAAQSTCVAILATLCLTFGLWVFGVSGGWHITAVGCYSLAFALFVGFSALYQWSVVRNPETMRILVPALACAYFVHVIMWTLFWSSRILGERADAQAFQPALSSTLIQSAHENRPPLQRAVSPRSLIVAASVLILVSLVGASLSGSAGVWLTAAGEVGLLLLAAGLFLGDSQKNWGLKLIVMAAAFMFVMSQISTGYGRLRIGTTGLALLIIMARGVPRYVPKLAIFVMSGPALVVFGRFRLDKEAQLYPHQLAPMASTNVDAKGLGSVVGPVESFARLFDLYRHGLLPMDWGRTFWASLVAFVPRSVWPAKPVGFGAEIVPLLHPDLVGTGQSDAALLLGEWLYDFGYVGLILMIVVVGLGVRAIDFMLFRTRGTPLADAHRLMIFLTAVTLAVGLSDLAWVGTFTFVVRAGTRLALLIGTLWLLSPKSLRVSPTELESDQFDPIPGVPRSG